VAAQILVVDDDDDLRDALVETIADRGYAVAGAQDGRQALEYLRDHPLPRLILADMTMPEMDGAELVAELNKDARLAGTAIVLITARPGAEAELGPLRVTGFLPKPFKLDALFKLLEQTVGNPA
jgi:CheY-like chemotaxis protein